MRAILISLCLLCSASPVLAQSTSADVMSAYNAYTQAIVDGDAAQALSQSKRAYELAEEVWGGSRKETALLAANYADRLVVEKKYGPAQPVYLRCAEILTAFPIDSVRSTLGYCEVRLAQSYDALDNTNAEDAYRRAIATLEPGLQNDTAINRGLAGEAYLAVARLSMPKSRIRGNSIDKLRQTRERAYREVGELSRKARPLLLETYGEESLSVGMSYLYEGYAQETAQEWAAARDLYEKAVDIFKVQFGEDDPAYFKAFGRYRYANFYAEDEARKEKQRLARDGRSPSHQKCYFWEQGEDDLELCPIKRMPPKFPPSAFDLDQGGFSIVAYDINEDGRTENIQVGESWPKNEFERSSADAVKRWTFAPPRRADGTIAKAVGVVTMITYELSRW